MLSDIYFLLPGPTCPSIYCHNLVTPTTLGIHVLKRAWEWSRLVLYPGSLGGGSREPGNSSQGLMEPGQPYENVLCELFNTPDPQVTLSDWCEAGWQILHDCVGVCTPLTVCVCVCVCVCACACMHVAHTYVHISSLSLWVSLAHVHSYTQNYNNYWVVYSLNSLRPSSL